MTRTPTFIALLLTTLIIFSLKPTGPEIELELVCDGNYNLHLSLAGTYKTEYVEGKIGINHNRKTSVEILPVHKSSNTAADNALAIAMATSLTIASGTLLIIAKKEIERKMESQYEDLYMRRCDDAIIKTAPIFEKLERSLPHD